MSLINKMLLDLEARQPSLAPAAAIPRPIYQDLLAANSALPPPPRVRMSLVLALFGVTAAAIIEWVWSPLAVSPLPVFTAPSPPPIAQVKTLSDVQLLPDISVLPAIENQSTSQVLTAQPEVPQLTVEDDPALSEQLDAPPPSSPALTAKAEPVNVEPVTVLKTQRIIPAAEHAQDAYQEGQRYNAERNYPEAERSWRSALDWDAQHRPAREQLVTLLLATGRAADAQRLLEEGMAIAPGYPAFALILARVQVERGQETEALVMLEQASSRTNGDVDISAFIATLHQRAGRHAEAAQRFQQVLAARPLEGRWWVGLAISLEAQQNWQAARGAYARAMNGTSLTAELMRYTEQRMTALRNYP